MESGMTHKINFGPLTLSLRLLRSVAPGPQSVGLSAAVATPYSTAKVEDLVCGYGDVVALRKRIRKFLSGSDDGVASLQVLMPLFDVAFLATRYEKVRIEVRLSSDVRFERHMFDFECSVEEVAAFARELDCALLSLALGDLKH
jgi:hypothetical protein